MVWNWNGPSNFANFNGNNINDGELGGSRGGVVADAAKVGAWPTYEAQYLHKRLEQKHGKYVTGPLGDVEKGVYLDKVADDYKEEADEALQTEFAEWLQGKHADNVKPKPYINDDGKPVRRYTYGDRTYGHSVGDKWSTDTNDPMWYATWWGQKPLTNLTGVREYLRNNQIKATQGDLEMNLLAEHGPQDINQAWMYFKHWVKGRPVHSNMGKGVESAVDEPKHGIRPQHFRSDFGNNPPSGGYTTDLDTMQKARATVVDAAVNLMQQYDPDNDGDDVTMELSRDYIPRRGHGQDENPQIAPYTQGRIHDTANEIDERGDSLMHNMYNQGSAYYAKYSAAHEAESRLALPIQQAAQEANLSPLEAVAVGAATKQEGGAASLAPEERALFASAMEKFGSEIHTLNANIDALGANILGTNASIDLLTNVVQDAREGASSGAPPGSGLPSPPTRWSPTDSGYDPLPYDDNYSLASPSVTITRPPDGYQAPTANSTQRSSFIARTGQALSSLSSGGRSKISPQSATNASIDVTTPIRTADLLFPPVRGATGESSDSIPSLNTRLEARGGGPSPVPLNMPGGVYPRAERRLMRGFGNARVSPGIPEELPQQRRGDRPPMT